MGVIHKLKPEVLNFIIENKQNNPALSCRYLTSLILEQLHVKVSKSSINAIFKENNLSMPIGRRRKLKKKKFNLPALPVIDDVKTVMLVREPNNLTQQPVVNASLQGVEGDKEGIDQIAAAAQEAAQNQRREEEARKLEEEKAAQELAEEKRRQEEAKKRELEELAQAEAKKKQLEGEAARKLKEEQAAQELARIKAQEEARQRGLEKAAQELAEEKRRQEETARKLAEEIAAQEVAKIKALEEVRLQELERLAQEAAQNQRREEEARKLAEEKAAQELTEEKRKREEARKLQEEKAALEAAQIRALEAELKAEKERWAKLAEQEQQSKQQADQEDVILPKVEFAAPAILSEERVCSGAVILKVLDCLIGGSKEINATISRAIGGRPEEFLKLTEALIFKSLFAKDKFSTLGDLIGVQFPQEKLSSYYAQIRQITNLGLDVAKIISNVFTEAKGVKINFIDKSVVHLDGQLCSCWPETSFPYGFSNTAFDLKSNLNKYFIQGAPLVLLSSCGYDIFPNDFFNLLLNIGSPDNYPESLTLFGNKLEELAKISLGRQDKRVLVFGLWPQQFISSRKVKRIGDFYLKHIQEIDQDLYLGEIEIDLFRTALNQSIALKGCAVKTELKGKIRLVILNSGQPAMGLEELAGIYLSRWPNFEESFQDFGRKIEIFAQGVTKQELFPRDSFGMDAPGQSKELAEIFANYIKMLDAYLRWRFLPEEYIGKDSSSTNECFYNIPVKFMVSQSRVRVRILVSQEYQFVKDLAYLICRLNERQINTTNGKKFWFESAFK